MQEFNNFDNNDKPHGDWELYFSDGKLSFKGSYIHGGPHGNWEGYRSDGDLLFKGKYDMGQEIGLWFEHNKLNFYARM